MENTMILLFRSILLSFIMAVSCRIFYETVVPMRRMRYDFMKYTVVPAFLAGFMVIAVTKIPPYIFQPVRVIVAVAVVAQIYYQVNVVKNLILSVMYCGLYWILSMFFFSLASVMPALSYRGVEDLLGPVRIPFADRDRRECGADGRGCADDTGYGGLLYPVYGRGGCCGALCHRLLLYVHGDGQREQDAADETPAGTDPEPAEPLLEYEGEVRTAAAV